MVKQRVLVDTCVIIEAFRTKCWKRLCARFDVETVECCITECNTGAAGHANRVDVPLEELKQGLKKIHAVDDLMLATLQLEYDNLPALDAGELHIMAWLHAHPDEAILTSISTSDRAAVRATHVLKLIDQLRSLQDLARQAGVGKKQLTNLYAHFNDGWLAEARVKVQMNVL